MSGLAILESFRALIVLPCCCYVSAILLQFTVDGVIVILRILGVLDRLVMLSCFLWSKKCFRRGNSVFAISSYKIERVVISLFFFFVNDCIAYYTNINILKCISNIISMSARMTIY